MKKENKLISVIIPVYKVEDYLSRCIDSVINQTYKNIEIILVDDGSPDNCPQLCDEYAKKDSRIVVIHKENGGLSDARNAGINVAKGDYFCFVDSDDFIDNRFVEILYTAIDKHDADISICKYEKFSVVENVSFDYDGNISNEVLDRDLLINKLFEKNNIHFITAWSKMYKKELFSNILFDKGKLHEDEFIVHKIFDICNKAVYVPLDLYKYYEREGSITKEKTFSKRNLDAYFSILSRYNYFIGSKYEQKSLNHLVNNIAYIYYNAKNRNANSEILRFLKKEYKKYYKINKKKNIKQVVFRYFTNIVVLMKNIINKKK